MKGKKKEELEEEEDEEEEEEEEETQHILYYKCSPRTKFSELLRTIMTIFTEGGHTKL